MVELLIALTIAVLFLLGGVGYFGIKVIRMKKSNDLMWQEYIKVQENRKTEVDILNSQIESLNERIAITLDLLNDSDMMVGTRITITNLLKRGTIPS
ncbi:MAG: hypothetical protein [Bacteriophage sp.]|nr:MAG: hypothetical protein [Bacteriophage sp.]